MVGSKYSRELKVAVNLNNLLLPLDPMVNPTLSNAFFSNNLYSNLIEVDEENRYQPDLASNMWFDNDERKIYFEFENSRVSAADAEFSLKRIILQNAQLHSDLWEIICDKEESRESCSSRIYSENNRLVIKYANQSRSSYIIPTLAAVDYKIVPIAAFDSTDPAKAKISDYTKTSGHYHLVKESNDYIFIKNKTSNLRIYDRFRIINAGNKDVASSASAFDIISTTVPLTAEVHQKITNDGWKNFNSYNISVVFIIFSQNGIKKTNVSQRFKIANLLADEMLKYLPHGAQLTQEIFQDFGQGYLNDDQKVIVKNLRNAQLNETIPQIKLGTKAPQMLTEFVKNNPSVELQKIDTLGINIREEEKPDFFSMSNDLSFDLNLSFIAFAAKAGILKMDKAQIAEFVSLETNDQKIDFLNKIHFETLKDCWIYPVWTVPYYTYFNGNFDNNLSKFNSRTLLWKIH